MASNLADQTPGPYVLDGCVQLLTPQGRRVPHGEFAYRGDLGDIRELYAQMVRLRHMDAECFHLQRKGELALWPPVLGQEAAQIGSAAAVRRQDVIYPSYRECLLGPMFGVDIAEVVAVWRGTSLGTWDPARFGPMSIVIGSHPLHAVGHGMALALDGRVANGDPERDSVVLTYFGDGATSEGDVMEAFLFAAVNNAPVVFFCSNNQYAISLPATRQSAAPIAQRATGFGFPSVRVDGNDVLAVQAVTARALQWAREGHGPTLIEAVTYRMGSHTTSDDATRYRDDAELERWRLLDPIDRVRRLLEASGTEPEFFAEVDRAGAALGEEVRAACVSLADPDLADSFDRVFAETTAELEEQRAEFVAWRDQYGVGV
jgi:pyruvate dehydrogenase E1 component alpha subunit